MLWGALIWRAKNLLGCCRGDRLGCRRVVSPREIDVLGCGVQLGCFGVFTPNRDWGVGCPPLGGPTPGTPPHRRTSTPLVRGTAIRGPLKRAGRLGRTPSAVSRSVANLPPRHRLTAAMRVVQNAALP